jgi:hypothetical protein
MPARSPALTSQRSTGRPLPPPLPPRSCASSAHRQDQALPPARSPAGAALPGSYRPSPRSASPSPTSCCTAGATTRPGHRRLARCQRGQPPQHLRPGRCPRLLGPGQPCPASRAGQAARIPARHVSPAPLPCRRRPSPRPQPRPGPQPGRLPADADMAGLGAAPHAPRGLPLLPYRAALSMMLAVAVTGAADCATAQDLIGLHPFNPSGLATFSARLREYGILEPATAAICQLARHLEENGAPHRLRPPPQAAPPRQPGPPARRHRRHHAPAHRPGRNHHPDPRRRGIRPRRPRRAHHG